MPFYIICEHCQRRLKVPNNVANQQIRCFACRKHFVATPPASRASKSLLEQSVEELVPGFVRRSYSWLERRLELLAPPFKPVPLLYLSFVILLLPLLMFSRSTNDYQKRINDMIKSAQQQSPHHAVDLDQIVKSYSGDKIPGAQLPRHSKLHWMYAALAWIGTLIFILLIFDRGSATLLQLSTVATFTATAGIGGLLFLQLLAMASFGTGIVAGPWWIIVIVLRIFAIAYFCAFFPGANIWASLFGFTIGVGFCEEFFKALPFISQGRHMNKTNYQTVCIWGLASGMGFGIAEGVFYSARFYNGMAPFSMYLVRFTSCVAIHAVLTAAAALLFFKHDRLINDRSFVSWGVVVISAIAPSAILHGIYDTLLKHEMAPAALFVSVLSFLWLVLQIEMAHARAVPDMAADTAVLASGKASSESLEESVSDKAEVLNAVEDEQHSDAQ